MKARGSIVFLTGLTIAFGTVFILERWNPVAGVVVPPKINVMENAQIGSPGRRELTTTELNHAKVAWQYFINNTNHLTGLVNSVDDYNAATLWDTSSYLLGLISAQKLEIVEQAEFDKRVKQLLGSLAAMPLFDGRLPNKSYSTIDTSMVTYNNESTLRGIGWSAIDIGRMLVAFNILVWQHPAFAVDVNQVLLKWDLSALVRDAEMYGATIDESDQTVHLQEGRLGYEEYAAKSLELYGIDLSRALDYETHLSYVTVNDIPIGTDLRTPDKFDALNAVVSEPYVLDGLEFGWDRYSRSLAYGVYRAQLSRYEQTGLLTAVSEDNIDEAPFFVYNTIFADGKAWNTVTETGDDASEFKSISTKTVFGLHALFNTGYTDLLMDEINGAYDKTKGWYSGIYELSGKVNKSITANTNGIILESLYYIKFGPLLSRTHSSHFAVSEQ